MRQFANVIKKIIARSKKYLLWTKKRITGESIIHNHMELEYSFVARKNIEFAVGIIELLDSNKRLIRRISTLQDGIHLDRKFKQGDLIKFSHPIRLDLPNGTYYARFTLASAPRIPALIYLQGDAPSYASVARRFILCDISPNEFKLEQVSHKT